MAVALYIPKGGQSIGYEANPIFTPPMGQRIHLVCLAPGTVPEQMDAYVAAGEYLLTGRLMVRDNRLLSREFRVECCDRVEGGISDFYPLPRLRHHYEQWGRHVLVVSWGHDAEDPRRMPVRATVVETGGEPSKAYRPLDVTAEFCQCGRARRYHSARIRCQAAPLIRIGHGQCPVNEVALTDLLLGAVAGLTMEAIATERPEIIRIYPQKS